MQVSSLSTQKTIKMERPVGFEPNTTGEILNNYNYQKPLRTYLERVTCSVLMLFIAACQLFFIACGGGGAAGGGSIGISLPEPYQGTTVSDTTVKGESHAARFLCEYIVDAIGGTCENDGVEAAPIDWTLKFPDDRELRRVILFTGGNTLKTESVDYAVEKYALLFWGIKSTNVYCVGLPPHYKLVQGGKEAIEEFNQAIKGLCGEDHYIDTISIVGDEDGNWKPGMTEDDKHLTPDAYQLVMSEIAKRDALLP